MASQNGLAFADRVVMITGGTSGIGRAAAVAYGRAGARVVVAGRRRQWGEETVEQVREAGGEALFVATDVTDEAQVKHLVESTVEAWGRLDVAFNNAGVDETSTPLVEKTTADFDRIMDVNVRGVFHCIRHQVARMLEQGEGGAIVNNASVAGLVGIPLGPIYTASKHAVVGLTRAVALELAETGIRINAVAPAAVQTDMLDRFATDPEFREQLRQAHPMQRFGTVDEVVAPVLALSAPGAGFITGQVLAIDGGFTAA